MTGNGQTVCIPTDQVNLSATVLFLAISLASATAQGTAFSYQGRLTDGQNSAEGAYDLAFTLFQTNVGGQSIAGPITNATVPVSNGLFHVSVDFGDVFSGAERWLEIAVRTNGGMAFTTLHPRQWIASTPYSITASRISGTLPATQLTGTVPFSRLPSSIVTNDQTDTMLTGRFSGDGSGLTNLNPTVITNTQKNVQLAGIGMTNNALANVTNFVSARFFFANGSNPTRMTIGSTNPPFHVLEVIGTSTASGGTVGAVNTDPAKAAGYDVYTHTRELAGYYAYEPTNGIGFFLNVVQLVSQNRPLQIRVWDTNNSAPIRFIRNTNTVWIIDTNGNFITGDAAHDIGSAQNPVRKVYTGGMQTNSGLLSLGDHLDQATNAMADWPAAAATPGGFALVNSNGVPFFLLSAAGSTVWVATNRADSP